jgi:phage terminase large subunit-like protein
VADPYRWAHSLEVLASDGLPVVEFPQSPQRMTPATARPRDMVNTRALTHDGDPRLARHCQQRRAQVRLARRRGCRRRPSPASTRRIDLAVCAVMALDRAVGFESVVEPQGFFITT